jgi:hypothetical protein
MSFLQPRRPRGRPRSSSLEVDPGLEMTCSARHEAEQLFAMVRIGKETVESVRELVDVPPRVCIVLRAAARAGVIAHSIDQALTFRAQVRQHFDAIVAARIGQVSTQ